ncbi:MAG: SRPBCC family protein [Thermoplasmata archaeon]
MAQKSVGAKRKGVAAQGRDLTFSFTVDQTPSEVFAAIKNVRGWWTGKPGIKGNTSKLGDEFSYQYEDLHFTKQRIIELSPNKKVVWKVLDSKLTFIKDKTEWNGTEVVFEVSKKGEKTEVRFTHLGLVPQVECYEACSDGWSFYIKGSLKNLITRGEGKQ